MQAPDALAGFHRVAPQLARMAKKWPTLVFTCGWQLIVALGQVMCYVMPLRLKEWWSKRTFYLPFPCGPPRKALLGKLQPNEDCNDSITTFDGQNMPAHVPAD